MKICHAELVSAPHMLSPNMQSLHLSREFPKQVRDDGIYRKSEIENPNSEISVPVYKSLHPSSPASHPSPL